MRSILQKILAWFGFGKQDDYIRCIQVLLQGWYQTEHYRPVASVDIQHRYLDAQPFPKRYDMFRQSFSSTFEGGKAARFKKILYAIESPTDEQWQVISSVESAHIVKAGAGSGKTFAMVYRVLFLLFQGIRHYEITVLLFNKKAALDFCERLLKESERFAKEAHNQGVPFKTLNPSTATSMVRTYHSKLMDFNRQSEEGAFQPSVFASNQDANPYQPVGQKGSSAYQELQYAYQLCYQRRKAFKQAIDKLYRFVLCAGKNRMHRRQPYSTQAVQMAMARDPAWMQHMQPITDDMLNRQLAQYPDVKKRLMQHVDYQGRYEQTSVSFRMHVAVDMPTYRAYLFLAPYIREWEHLGFCDDVLVEENGDINFYAALSVKHRILTHISEQAGAPAIFLAKDEQDVARFLDLVRWDAGAPIFSFGIGGDIPSVIFTAFEATASFVESHGLDVACWAHAILQDAEMKHTLAPSDQVFLKALSIFWPFFNERLIQGRQMTFNALFQSFSQKERVKEMGFCEVASSMRHMIIDEAQDASVLITLWLKNILHTCQTLTSLPYSLMTVGDASQSIYAWRGADSQLLLSEQGFQSVFGMQSPPASTMLSICFRCSQEVLNMAAMAVPTALPSRAHSAHKKGTVSFIDIPQQEKDGMSFIKKTILQRVKGYPKLRGLVLTRRNQTCDHLKNAMQTHQQVDYLTIFRAKGMEADWVIVVDNIPSAQANPVKNLIYPCRPLLAQTRTHKEYLDAENTRLIYVALTRSKGEVQWWLPSARSNTDMVRKIYDGYVMPFTASIEERDLNIREESTCQLPRPKGRSL